MEFDTEFGTFPKAGEKESFGSVFYDASSILKHQKQNPRNISASRALRITRLFG